MRLASRGPTDKSAISKSYNAENSFLLLLRLSLPLMGILHQIEQLQKCVVGKAK